MTYSIPFEKKRYFTVFCLLISLVCQVGSQSLPPIVVEGEEQVKTETKVAFLKKWAKADSIRYYKELAKAKEVAKKMGYPLTGRHGNGGSFALQGFDEFGELKYYITNNRGGASTISTDEVWSGGNAGTSLSGEGRTLAIWDGGRIRTSHNEFSGRVLNMENGQTLSSHATHVTGTCVASGINPAARGMAFRANARVFDFDNDISEIANEGAIGLRVLNHSYGSIPGWEFNEEEDRWEWWGSTSFSNTEDFKFGYYDTDARNIDQIVFNAPFYLPVKSAGNDRDDHYQGTHWVKNSNGVWIQSNANRPPDGGLEGYDCIPTMGTAKNILTVGAVRELSGGYAEDTQPEDVRISSFSSWGPTDDGRIKPDIVAKGVNVFSTSSDGNNAYEERSGTSMSAPMVTGSIHLIQEHIDNLYPGASLRASAVKALIIHTADECGDGLGPDYKYGWGLMNTQKAVEFLSNESGRHWFRTGDSIRNNDPRGYGFPHDGIGGFKVTIAWTDRPGNVCQPPSGNWWVCDRSNLVNDLDVRLVNLSDNTIYYPWRLNPSNPSNPATRGDNEIDNVEQIYIPELPAGQYGVVISHKGILVGSKQIFSIMVSGIGENQPISACSEAIQIQCGQSIAGTSSGPPQTLPFCEQDLNTASGKWFRLTGSGKNIVASTCFVETKFDTKIGIFTGECEDLICIAANDDDDNCGSDEFQSSVQFFAEMNEEYFIYVTGYDEENGDFLLTIYCEDPTMDCPSPNDISVVTTGYSHFALDWEDSPDTEHYTFRYREQGGNDWIIQEEWPSSFVIFGRIIPCSTYEWQVRSNCQNSDSDWSPILRINTTGCDDPYCYSYGIAWRDWIDEVHLKGMSNSSGQDFGYSNYTNLQVEAQRGEILPLTLTPATDDDDNDDEKTVYWNIWVDYNQDSDFGDSGELVFQGSGSNRAVQSGNFTIPSNALLGSTRIRVSMSLESEANPCLAEGLREIEDYSIQISAAQEIPVANFSASPQSGTAPLNVSFSDLSSNEPTAWSWEFQGGIPATSTAKNPSVVYNTPGTYFVTLTASNAAGSDVEVKTGYITVSPAITTPVANFSANPQSGTAPLNVSFTDLSSNEPTAWSWEFQGGIPATSTVQTPTVVYNTPGTYFVTLTASNAAGSDVEVKTGYITVSPAVSTPEANFSANPQSGTAPLNVSFTDLSSNEPTAWSWEFQGGVPATSTEQHPSVVYNSAGTYFVTLTASNAAGSDVEVKTSYITVSPAVTTPVANFSANPQSGTAPLNVSFTDLSSNEPTTWSWEFQGGVPATSTEQHPSVVYNSAGTYFVTLTASNAAGSDVEVKTGYITVSPAVSTPEANFSANPQSGTAPLNVSFTDLSSNEPTAWSWEFQGGVPATSTEQHPSVVYNSAGTHFVTLTASNAAGSDVEVKTSYIIVNEPVSVPNVDFIADKSEGPPPLEVQFTDQSTNSPTFWNWEFEGGTPSTSVEQHPKVTYQTPGDFYVILTAGNAAGNNAEIKVDFISVQNVNSTQTLNQVGSARFYPNPSTSIVNFELDLDTSRSIELKVRDIIGREVYKNNYFQQKLKEQFQLPTGSYVISLVVDQKYMYRGKLLVFDK